MTNQPLRVERQSWLGAQVLSYPDRLPTTVHALDLAATRHGERIGFIDGDRSITYAAFADLVEGAADALRGRGVQRGDRVAVAAPNSLGLAVAAFACARGGFTMVGLGTHLQPARWATMLRHSRAVAAFGAPAQLDDLADAAAQADGVPVHELSELLARRLEWGSHAGAQPDEASPYAVVYTSGTTGAPKGSLVVHRASMHSAHSYQAILELAPDDRTAVLFPLTYISGVHAHVLPAMLGGATCVLVPRADPASYLRVLMEHGITWAYTVPSLWRLLLRRRAFASPRLDHVRIAGFGGSPFPRSDLAALQSVLRNARLLDIYGLTETHSPAAIRLPEDPADKLGSVGRPLPCMEARTVDGGREVAGSPGELLLRGSLVTTGYLDDPEATRAAIRDGWLRTGDVARIDDEGYVWLMGRTKDVIDRGGHTIHAAEVEEVLNAHPDVADAAVVGVPDRTGTEIVACLVVPEPGREPTLASLRRWVGGRLAVYATPRLLQLTDALPRNRTGKLDKRQVRDAFMRSLPDSSPEATGDEG